MQETWDLGLIPGSGRSPGGGHGNPLQSSCLENPRDRGPWRAVVHEAANKRIQLKLLSMQSIIMFYFSFQCPILRDEIVYQARKICWTKSRRKFQQCWFAFFVGSFTPFFFLATTCSMQDLNSPTRDWTRDWSHPCPPNWDNRLDHWTTKEVPDSFTFKR